MKPPKLVFKTLAHPDCVPCAFGPRQCWRIAYGCKGGKNMNYIKKEKAVKR